MAYAMSTDTHSNKCSTFLTSSNDHIMRKSITLPLMRTSSNPQLSSSTSSSSSEVLIDDTNRTRNLRKKNTDFMSNRRIPSDSALSKDPSTSKANQWEAWRSPHRPTRSSVFALTNHDTQPAPFATAIKSRGYQTKSANYSKTLSPASRFRSKSLLSTDLKSPYFPSSSSFRQTTIPREVGRFTRIPSDPTAQRFRTNFMPNFHPAAAMQPILGFSPFRRASEAIFSPEAALHYHDLHAPQRPILQASMMGNGGIPGINKTIALNDPIFRTIGQHYYPEGGWGWIVTVCASLCLFITSAMFPASSFLILDIVRTFKPEEGILAAVLIGSFSTMVTLILSPILFAVCRRKSTRLTAVVGGLVTALGCLFTSFATQFHQILISYGIFIGIGISMLRDSSVIMVGQYFKKRREFVEIFVMSGNGLGIAIMPVFLSFCIRSQNWRTGFQSLALVAFINFFIAVLYRSASLYHPQRRAILHLKSLQRKTRLKASKYNENPTVSTEKLPYFDFSILKSRTMRILLSGTCISHFGLTTPLFLMAHHGERAGLHYPALLGLQTFLGLGMVLGTIAFGWIVVKNNVDCMIARQYLCQASSLMISASLLAFTTLNDYSGFLLFTWIYGFFLGGYLYSLKMYVYEKVRARNFNRAWGFVQSIQSLPILVGVPISAFLSEYYGNKSGYFLSSFCTCLGSVVLFLIDGHRKNLEERNRLSSSSGGHYHPTPMASGLDQLSSPLQFSPTSLYADPPSIPFKPRLTANGGPKMDISQINRAPEHRSSAEFDPKTEFRTNTIFSSPIAAPGYANGELTCISEEVFMENFLGDYELSRCITPCDREEKYVLLSEFENNFESGPLSEETAALIKMSRKQDFITDMRVKAEEHLRECPLREKSSIKRPSTMSFSKPGLKKRRASYPVLERTHYESDDPVYGSKHTDNDYEVEPGAVASELETERCMGCLRIVQHHVQMNEKEVMIRPQECEQPTDSDFADTGEDRVVSSDQSEQSEK